MVRSQVIQWGNSLAIKLPKPVRDTLNLSKGDFLNIYLTDKNEMVIKRADGEVLYDTYKAGEIVEEEEI